MIPRNTFPHTHHDLVRTYHAQYAADIASQKYLPLVYPWSAFGAIIAIIYLLIPHKNRPWLRHARFPIYAVNVAHVAYIIKYVRGKDFATTLSVGLISSWSLIWMLAILVCNDAQKDFMRIERMGGVFRGMKQKNQETNGLTKEDLDEKKSEKSNGSLETHPTDDNTLGPRSRHGEFAWQPYPLTPFVERLDWVLDIFFNFRGAGWNWRTIATPPPPKAIQTELIRNTPNPPIHTFKPHPSQTHVYPTHRSLLVANLKTLVSGYLILDLVKTLIVHDPYFWGLVDAAPAPYIPFSTLLTSHPPLLRITRLAISQFAIMWALKSVFSLAPLFFSGTLGPALLGARAEPWIYPETWGSYAQVLDKGLAGWWSSWWHQTFRFAFEQPSRKIIQIMRLKPKSAPAKMLQLVTAFALSGVLHACGSYTCHGPTHPLSGPMSFFLLQAAAVFIEAFLRPLLVASALPRSLKRGLTFVYVHVWFYHTAPLLCDDFARGGVWLFEPIPVSVFRGGLGLGVEGDGWWCWGESGLRWFWGERWWMSGIAG
ncbi:hypothetical protein P280DRAFT_457443 [Massarina eburnea CBS 473.64]|uniref:Wax synthase domain-containing protein n=1 Tax=Massarina eburnea CBS 473.64 TaxID=1395130 RepID=A0A6A6RTU2_9PLEO|nr:hypothetical protein P280DRAFT_457443 [Massarina eburnea CBS 473.64]